MSWETQDEKIILPEFTEKEARLLSQALKPLMLDSVKTKTARNIISCFKATSYLVEPKTLQNLKFCKNYSE